MLGKAPLSRHLMTRVGEKRHFFRTWARQNFAREVWSWAWAKSVRSPDAGQLAEALALLDGTPTTIIDQEDRESPIFILAGGWRTGSTLFQRILVSDRRLFLWGEPLGELAILPSIVQSLYRIIGFPRLDGYYLKEGTKSVELPTSWIGTLYPHGTDLRSGLRSLFDRWLAVPARNRGFSRWGFKEVRLGAAEAVLLRWLYPRAKFIILSRHPYDCYRSLSDSGWHHVFYRRPDVRVDSAGGFARHWNRLAMSWLQLPEGFPALHVKYEDLTGDSFDFRQLEAWLGIEIEEKTALSTFVGRTAIRTRLSWYERMIIKSEAAAGMRALGYSRNVPTSTGAVGGSTSRPAVSTDERNSIVSPR